MFHLVWGLVALFMVSCSDSEPDTNLREGPAPSLDPAFLCSLCGGIPGLETIAPAVDPGSHVPVPEPGPVHTVTVSTNPVQVVPANLPADVVADNANNNLAAATFEGATFLAFRSAPDHFASPQARMYVVRSVDDGLTWSLEGTFATGRDLREPEFLVLGGTLFLYISELGVDAGSFDPGRVLVTERQGAATWKPLEQLFADGRVVWRVKNYGGTAFMSYYVGGENIYRPLTDLVGPDGLNVDAFTQPFAPETLEVRLAESPDGRTWTDRSTVRVGGGSETAFSIDSSGAAVAVMRVELAELRDGAQPQAGSALCQAKTVRDTWQCTLGPEKFDSPAMFEQDGELYLVARRSLDTPPGGNGGEYGYKPVVTSFDYGELQRRYVCSRKRCALWRVIPAENRVAHVADLPSKGDTCFPSVVPGPGANTWVVYDYSSPLDSAEDPAWCVGQQGPTVIYRHVIQLDPKAP